MVHEFKFSPKDYLASLGQQLLPTHSMHLIKSAQCRAQHDMARAMAAARDRNCDTAADRPINLPVDLMSLALCPCLYNNCEVTSDGAGIYGILPDATGLEDLL